MQTICYLLFPYNGYFTFHVFIFGYDAHLWCSQNGIFHLLLRFSDKYPMEPPNIQFTSKIFHPNVYLDGTICLDVLTQEKW